MNGELNRYIFSVLVENHAGVLSRISGLFTRRGYNIDSLTVAETENPDYSRMTIALHGDSATVEQIQKQLEKQIDVKEVEQLGSDIAVIREHAIIKVFCTPENRMSIVAVADIFRANVIDVSKDSLMVELTGDSTKVDAFVEIVKPFGIKQIVRSGITALKRG